MTRFGLRRLLPPPLMVAAAVLGIYAGRATPALAASPRLPIQIVGAAWMDGEVPAGYPRSRPGAVAAATNYGAVLAGPLILGRTRYRAAERVIAAPRRATASWTRGSKPSPPSIAAWELPAPPPARVAIRYVPVAYCVAA